MAFKAPPCLLFWSLPLLYPHLTAHTPALSKPFQSLELTWLFHSSLLLLRWLTLHRIPSPSSICLSEVCIPILTNLLVQEAFPGFASPGGMDHSFIWAPLELPVLD